MSWVVSHKWKFIFVHVPKTGGTSVSGPKTIWQNAALFRFLGKNDVRPGGHRTAAKLRELYSCFDEYFKFAFIREPLERTVSMYWAVHRTPIRGNVSFDEYVSVLPVASKIAHFGFPQSWWIKENGDVGVDYVGDFAKLDRCFVEVCDKIGLPRIRVPRLNSSGRTDHLDVYSERTERIVREVYAEDFELYEEFKR
jgi:hypothetical protein